MLSSEVIKFIELFIFSIGLIVGLIFIYRKLYYKFFYYKYKNTIKKKNLSRFKKEA